MTYGSQPKDQSQIPISCVYVPGVGFVPLQGSTLTNTDGSSNQSTPANFNVSQIGGVATQMTTGDGVAGANVPEQGIGLSTGGANLDRWRAVNGLNDNNSAGIGALGGWLFNGANWDRQRANLDNIALVPSAAYTTTQTVTDQTNYNHRGIIVVLDMTVPGTGSVTLEIDGKDPVSGKYYAILTGVAVTTLSTNIYRVYPGLTAVANATASDVLPRTWRVKVTANNANSATYSVGAMLML